MTDHDRRALLRAIDSSSSDGFGPSLVARLLDRNSTTGNSSAAATAGVVLDLVLQTQVNVTTVGGFDGGQNGTNLTGNRSLGGTRDDQEQSTVELRYWVLCLLAFPIFTIFGNVLVVMSVLRERSLQSVTNYFIVSLAFADILVGAIVMPISVVVEVLDGVWNFADILCDLWIMCDALFSTASILNLVAISIDRFIAVTQPIRYSKHKNSKRTHVTIAATWLLSMAIALPIGCGLQNLNGIRNRDDFKNVCTFFHGDFLIYSSLGSFYIPCLVMLVLYYRIFKVIWHRAKRASASRKGKVYANAKTAPGAEDHRQEELAGATMSLMGAPANRPRRPNSLRVTTAHSDPPQMTLPMLRLQQSNQQLSASNSNSIRSRSNQPEASPQIRRDETLELWEADDGDCSLTFNDNCGGEGDDGVGDCGPSTSENICRVCDKTKKPKHEQQQQLDSSWARRALQIGLRKRHRGRTKTCGAERSAAKREKKATKTLAIVLGVFLLCWLPFFISNLMWAACLKNIDTDLFNGPLCKYDRRIAVFIVWLGYINSTLNPLIYTIFNNEFRKAFKKLLHIH